jgi:hypothetical protein
MEEIMKFMESIFTQEGPGVVVARGIGGEALVCIRREAWQGAQAVSGPCLNVMMKRCAVHGVWYFERCLLCEGNGND